MRAAAEIISPASLVDRQPRKFIALLRNRPIGHETSAWLSRSGGGMMLRAHAALKIGAFDLEQSVMAAYDCALRPEWCSVTVKSNTGEVLIDIELARDTATVRHRVDGRIASTRIALQQPPLFLVDNCFALHALAAVLADPASGRDTFTAIPAGSVTTVTAGGDVPVLFGGSDLGRPALNLQLAPGLTEHVWLDNLRVTRMAIPQLGIRVEACDDLARARVDHA